MIGVDQYAVLNGDKNGEIFCGKKKIEKLHIAGYSP